MPDILFAVIIGGLIASITPIINLIIEHKRWKREKKLEHLKAQRQKLEDLSSQNLKRLAEGMAKNIYSSDMAAEIMYLMPENVSELYLEFLKDKDKTDEGKKDWYWKITFAMKQSLSDIDKKIEDLLS